MSELLDQTRALMCLRHYSYKTELLINSNAVDNTLNFEYYTIGKPKGREKV